MICISRSNFVPKHERSAYENFLEITGVEPTRAAMFEDLSRNLAPAHDLGFTTVLVTSEKDWSREPETARPASASGEHMAHVHHTTDDLPGFLNAIAPTSKLG